MGNAFKKIIIAVALCFLAVPAFNASAAEVGDLVVFNVDENFEKDGKVQIQAVMVKNSPNLYFYFEKSWWDAQVLAKQQEVLANLEILSNEFSAKIYPNLTSIFGSEWRPGVDGDTKITLLLHGMKEGLGGYYRSTDEYVKLQLPASNEREMIYLPLSQIDNILKLKVFLAHEFVHMITFNQKDRLQGVQEEVWLNEARAEYSATILGYNTAYEGSNLQSRVQDFLEKPSDSLTEWQDGKYDYAAINVFIHYLTDHYGITMLSDSLKLKSTGIASINEVLVKNNYQEDFSQIFTNWTITMATNNCLLGPQYCYLNIHLDTLKISPTLIFLPVSGSSSLAITNVTKNWSGNWQKIIGGNGNLKLKFSSLAGLDFKVPYLVFEKGTGYFLRFLQLDANQQGEITLEDFGEKYTSLIIMPSLQTKLVGFVGPQPTYPYSFTVSIQGEVLSPDQILIQKLLAEIEALKKQIADLQMPNPRPISCSVFNSNLYFGLTNNDVACLQEFLKMQGADIYPEGLVTGFFGTLTRGAIVRFQKKYGIPATGFVGPLTRAKINQMINEK